MAEKYGWPFPLLSYMQGDAIGLDIVLLEKRAAAAKTFRACPVVNAPVHIEATRRVFFTAPFKYFISPGLAE